MCSVPLCCRNDSFCFIHFPEKIVVCVLSIFQGEMVVYPLSVLLQKLVVHVLSTYLQRLTECLSLLVQKLVVKPDQLIKRRGKLGLIKAGVDLQGVQEWLKNKLNKDFQVPNTALCTNNMHPGNGTLL